MSKQQVKIVKLGKHFGVQLKYSDSLPAFVDCQKDSESTGENGTQVKPVLLAAEIFAVHTANVYSQDTFSQLYESARNAKIVCKCQVE